MAFWDEIIPAEEREHYATAGYGKRQGLGDHPALIVIDVTYEFIGDKPEPVLESIKRWPHSSGEVGWKALTPIANLIAAAREIGAPIFYTRGQFERDATDAGRWGGKLARGFEWPSGSPVRGDDFAAEIAPKSGDTIVRKDKPSAFFGTPLMAYLNERHVDTVLITGCTTSGCVRATAIDAFSFNFKVGVIADGVFDRAQTPHKANLFDLSQKYADVMMSEEAVTELQRIGKRQRQHAA
jgi:nicotinamidase-related amidase